MRKLLQCEKALLRSETANSFISVWEMMEHFERDAKVDLLNELDKHDAVALIFCDWHREKDPERFVLRASCLAEVENKK